MSIETKSLFDSFESDFGEPSLENIFKTSVKIVTVGFCVILFLMAFQIFAIVDQIQTGNWEKVSGTVKNAGLDYNSGDGDSYPTIVTVAYTYLDENYTTSTYSYLNSDWGENPEHWLAIESIDIYVNPDNPSEAVYMAGLAGIVEWVMEALFFLGLILGLYLVIGVPAWIFFYAKVRRDND